MKLYKSQSVLGICFFIVVLIISVSSTALAADLLSIQPVKYDTGVVDEGVPAVMQATVENISDKEVRVGNVKAN
jgi:hypothetical protein